MYVDGNPKTKKALRDLVAAAVTTGDYPDIFSPGPFPAPINGEASVEGPHYPKAHTWYARVRVHNGSITKVLS